jgi:hypothetical protein
MGGQACVLYGAAEFTRDSDFCVAADGDNLRRLRAALAELRARRTFVPALGAAVLARGHACHFVCTTPELHAWRIDVMARLRGCDQFEVLWARRRQARLPGLGTVDVLNIRDLVRAKKTQRDKDWPMIARLVVADYLAAGARPPRERVEFWLREARSPQLLLELVRRFRGTAQRLAAERVALAAALRADTAAIEQALDSEQRRERLADRAFWRPLRDELRRIWRGGRTRRNRT